MQITIEYTRKPEKYQLLLGPLPAWKLKKLTPIPVPAHLRNPSDVTQAFQESTTFQVQGKSRARALRLIEALTTASRKNGMTATAQLNKPAWPDNPYNQERHDRLRITLTPDQFTLTFQQGTLDLPHKLTPREEDRARQGFLTPDEVTVPDPDLTLVLSGPGPTFWANDWQDNPKHRIENDLAQILEEIKLRHDAMNTQRAEEAEESKRRAAREQKEQEEAVHTYQHRILIEAMTNQATNWEQAQALHKYAAAIRDKARSMDTTAQHTALDWAKQIDEQAKTIDPFSSPIKPPKIPEPSWSDLYRQEHPNIRF